MCDAINLARSTDRLSARQTNVVRNSAGPDFGLALKSLQAPHPKFRAMSPIFKTALDRHFVRPRVHHAPSLDETDGFLVRERPGTQGYSIPPDMRLQPQM